MNTTRITPGYFFLSAGVLVSLITMVTAFLNVIFETLNHVFPDALNATYAYGYGVAQYAGMQSALAVLMIAGPLCLVLLFFWGRAAQVPLSTWNTVIRKWMIYLVLFLVSVMLLVDLILLVNYFVSGDVTVRFIYKVLLVLITGGIVGWYFILQQKSEAGIHGARRYVFLAIGSVFILGAVVYAFVVMGSPMKIRALRLDEQRLTDLQNIQSQVITYWQQKETLPSTLTQLIDPLQSWQSIPRDPEFAAGRSYEYTKISDKTFSLCATFSEPIPQGWQENMNNGIIAPVPVPVGGVSDTPSVPVPAGLGINESWEHGIGHTCFTRTVDPDRYPPFKKQ